MADVDPTKQLQHLLDDPGKVLEKSRAYNADSAVLPGRYRQVLPCWFAFWLPAFGALIAIFRLMIVRPQ